MSLDYDVHHQFNKLFSGKKLPYCKNNSIWEAKKYGEISSWKLRKNGNINESLMIISWYYWESLGSHWHRLRNHRFHDVFSVKSFISKDRRIHICSEFAKNRLENDGAMATFSIPSPTYCISVVSSMLTWMDGLNLESGSSQSTPVK